MKGIYTSLLESFELYEEDPAPVDTSPSSAQSLQFSATPEKIKRFQELLAKAQVSYDTKKQAQGQPASSAATGTTGGSTQSLPAFDQNVKNMQDEMNTTKHANLKSDGIKGQHTIDAMKAYPDIAAKYNPSSTQAAAPTNSPGQPSTAPVAAPTTVPQEAYDMMRQTQQMLATKKGQ
jgi:hypothetical protein